MRTGKKNYIKEFDMVYLYWYLAIGCLVGVFAINELVKKPNTDEDEDFQDMVSDELGRSDIRLSPILICVLMGATTLLWPILVLFAVIVKILAFFAPDDEEEK